MKIFSYALAILLLWLIKSMQCNSMKASCNTKLSDLKHSITKVICPANCLGQSSDLCGSDDYATGPLCLAAIHAGLIDEGGGYFEVFQSDPKSQYGASERNGVKSNSCTSAKKTYSFEMKCSTTGHTEFSVTQVFCPPGCSSNYVCGTNSYHKNSSICGSAIHAGFITDSGGQVTVYSKNGSRSFVGSNNHGIASKLCGSSGNYFTFQHEETCTRSCSDRGNCLAGINQQFCSCNKGFNGENCEIDINECLQGTHNCHQNATCYNTVGSFQCLCKSNYTGDGVNCVPNYCNTNPGICGNRRQCMDTNSFFNCSCTIWYSGNTCETVILDHKIMTTPMNWSDSRSYCQSIGGDLATWGMRNATTRQSILDNLVLPRGNTSSYWIGLNDIAHEGNFVYVDGVNTTSGNTDFQPGEPNNGGELVDNQDCGHLYALYNFKMDDIECFYYNFAICERIP